MERVEDGSSLFPSSYCITDTLLYLASQSWNGEPSRQGESVRLPNVSFLVGELIVFPWFAIHFDRSINPKRIPPKIDTYNHNIHVPVVLASAAGGSSR
jgi:hypothetical protein